MQTFLTSVSTSWQNELGRECGERSKFGFVLGNESGDLDSAVSAAVLAFFYTGFYQRPYFPVLNFAKSDLVLKTEVGFTFEKLYKVRHDFKNTFSINIL